MSCLCCRHERLDLTAPSRDPGGRGALDHEPLLNCCLTRSAGGSAAVLPSVVCKDPAERDTTSQERRGEGSYLGRVSVRHRCAEWSRLQCQRDCVIVPTPRLLLWPRGSKPVQVNSRRGAELKHEPGILRSSQPAALTQLQRLLPLLCDLLTSAVTPELRGFDFPLKFNRHR